MNKVNQYKKNKQLDSKNLNSDKWDHDGFDQQVIDQTSNPYQRNKYKNQKDQNKKRKNYQDNKEYQSKKDDQIKKPDRAYYQPPNRNQIKNTSISSNSDIKNIETYLNDVSNISLNFIEKELKPLENINEHKKSELFFDSKSNSIESSNCLMECSLHFPNDTEHINITSFNDFDPIMEKICQRHNLDVMMSLSIKIMILKQYLDQKPQEKNNLLFLSDGYFERFHKLINQDNIKNISSGLQNNLCIDIIQNF